MTSIFPRIISKLFIFLFIVCFIFFFVVYGYRYHKDIGFMSKNVFVEFKFFSDNNEITFDGKKYYPSEKSLDFFNIYDGCYDIKYNTDTVKRCFEKNKSFSDVFISYGGISDLDDVSKLGVACKKVNSLVSDTHCVGDKCFSEDISNAFEFNKINFVKVQDQLLYCNNGFGICKDLAQISGDIVCGNKDGLIYYDGKKYKMLKLK